MATGKAASEAAQQRAPDRKDSGDDRGPGSVAGNLTKDPDLRYTNSGKAVCNLRIASSQGVRDPETGEWSDGPAVFYDVQCWGLLAENVTEYLAKGYLIVAEGWWREVHWQADDGTRRTKVVLVARDLGPSLRFHGARVVRGAPPGGE